MLVKWHPPHRLLYTSGCDWKYQKPQSICDQLKQSLPKHFEHWKQKKSDKQLHPAYLIWSGPGTGKSRLLDEFLDLCTESVHENKDLLARFGGAYVFKISFENGTKTTVSADGTLEVGTRMMFQLRATNKTWDQFSREKENQKLPGEVINALAQTEGRKLEDMTVLILVDGIQELPHQNGEKNSPMKVCMDTVIQMINSAPFFCIGVFAGTFYGKVEDILSSSPQWQMYLTPEPLDGHIIISSTDPLAQYLVDDMGGHGRALEALEEQLRKVDIKDCSISIFMNNIRASLEQKYPPLQTAASQLVPALLAVLLRYPLGEKDLLPNSNLTVDSIVQLGLFRFEKPFLKCPFVFVWLLATWSHQSTLAHFKLEAYDEKQKTEDPGLPTGLQCWQHWEEVSGQFRMLKSALLKGKTVPFSELHAGALLGEDSKLKVQVTELKNLLRASHQYPTSGKREQFKLANDCFVVGHVKDILYHETGTVRVSDCDSFIINAPSAVAADGFCGIKLEDDHVVRELHQNKHIQQTVDTELFTTEHKKCARQKDFFILYTTHDSTVDVKDLPSRAGLVCRDNFRDYFGPFAARAFQTYKICINKATRSQLEAASGIGTAIAELILSERKRNGEFKDCEDFKKRCKMERTFSE